MKSKKTRKKTEARSESRKKAPSRSAPRKRMVVLGEPGIIVDRPNEGLPSPKRTDRGAIYCGFHLGGDRMATLEEVRDPQVPTRSIGELSHAELVTLVLERLRRDKAYPPLRMLGAKGIIDRRRAMREVGRLTPIGLHLIEIEKEYVQLQLKRR